MSFSIDGISSLVSNAQNSAAAGSASALKNSISSVSSGSSEEELLSVCKDFESYFVEEVLKEVKENLISDDDEDKDSSLSTLTDFHMVSTIELVADEIVDQVGENYTQQLYEQMKRNYGIE